MRTHGLASCGLFRLADGPRIPAAANHQHRGLRIGLKFIALQGQKSDQAVRLGRARLSAYGGHESVLDPQRVRRSALVKNSLRQRARSLDKSRVVQQGQRLKRTIGTNAARACRRAVGRVEQPQGRMQRRAEPERIEAPPIAVRTERRRPCLLYLRSLHPAGRDRRINARAAEGRIQQAAGGKRRVANDLRLHAEPRLARQQSIPGIALFQIRTLARRLPVNRRSNDQAMNRLLAPAARP